MTDHCADPGRRRRHPYPPTPAAEDSSASPYPSGALSGPGKSPALYKHVMRAALRPGNELRIVDLKAVPDHDTAAPWPM
ncbi:hypothetical protein ACFFMN_12095 [Planobispora siamensis]|uniref:Uncharacterized protein n=1 Tax=Planobispora siamensis TaxID=936338 RepID=A0A8J3SBU4_9ACTN|nr:hypothetical protein [Planobispora siamensis]GIH89907.1 hypothetical protein Psi01_05370 [Planobispora siamensis]